MEFTWKKILAVGLGFIAIFVVPIFLMSNGMLDYYMERAEKEPDSGFNKWLLMAASDVAYRTMRPEKAAKGYKQYLDQYPKEPDRPDLLHRYGMALENAHRNSEALQVYEQIRQDYPGTPAAKLAAQSVDRVRYVKGAK